MVERLYPQMTQMETDEMHGQEPYPQISQIFTETIQRLQKRYNDCGSCLPFICVHRHSEELKSCVFRRDPDVVDTLCVFCVFCARYSGVMVAVMLHYVICG